MASAVRVLVDATTGTNTGTSANRAIKNDEPDTRQRVVGLDDWCGVPTGDGMHVFDLLVCSLSSWVLA